MIGDRYSLDREIGRGGMGSVWLGRDEVLGRAVALKRVGVPPGASSPDLMRAEREARIAASLNHPHIVGVFDLVDDTDHQYLVMEYVEGTTLADMVRERGALPQREAARLLAQVASALTAAHANGVVHRDVKPSNILVRTDGEVKLSDFGIARSEADSSLTQTGLVTGSPAYLSPEVASGKLATPASDVWSLGATLFHAITGRPPYDVGDNVLGALYQIVNEPPPRLDDAGELEPVLLATMAHDPGRRWAVHDVERVLELVAMSDDAAAPARRHEGTQQLRAVPPPPAHPEPARTELLAAPPPVEPPVVPPPVAEAPAPPPRGRRLGVLPVLVTLLVVALVGAIIYLATLDDPQDNVDEVGPPPSTSPSTSSSEPSSSAPSTPAPATAEQMNAFIRDYVVTASNDPRAGFELLTPAFQVESNGFGGYRGFWGDVSNARVLDVQSDPDTLQVTYTYAFDKGGRPDEDTVQLQLVQDGDQLLIDGEA
ncbi:serine/threonine-protein kinase [Nocardioides sp. C4-1]|uniref:serine/threonine-protein kinase n=1 Tax=Nocardioides sp. C4-1 TaxID=3151851 RepID=UPI0032659814